MASPLRLAAHGWDWAVGHRAWQAVSTEFEAAEQALSRFRASSDLTRLNRAAGPDSPRMAVDRRLFVALAAAHRAGRITAGRFDARVLPHLERLGYRGAAVGSAAGRSSAGRSAAGGSVADGPSASDWADLGRDGSAALRVPVDLGGIGKGLALRWAASIVRRDLRPGWGALLEAGGDVVACGSPIDGETWLVAIEDPGGVGGEPAVVRLGQGALATSSVAINTWRAPDGRVVHHLIDPRTGEPGGFGLLSVTVCAADPAWAEVWSKALFLEGATGIADLARGRGLAAWWVLSDGRLEMTSAARVQTVWTARD